MGNVVYLILQQQGISIIEGIEAGPDLVPVDALVAAGEEDDGVLAALLLDLDDRVARRLVLVDDDVGHVDAEGRQAVHQPAAVPPDAAGVGHRRPGQGQGRRLVGPLAAGEDPVAAAGQGFPRPNHVIDVVDVIDVEGAEVEDRHLLFRGVRRGVTA